MIILDVFNAAITLALVVICFVNAFKWFNVTLTDKIKNYPFDRYYSLFVCVIFAYAGSSFHEEFVKKLKPVIEWFIN